MTFDNLRSEFSVRSVLLFVVMFHASQLVLAKADCEKGTIMSAYGLHALEAPPGKVVYYGKDSLQYGELHLPSGNGPFPVIVMIHGGCWLAYCFERATETLQVVAGIGICNAERNITIL